MGSRWLGVGTSGRQQSASAGAEAASAALAGRDDAQLIIAFGGPGHDLADFLRGVNRTTGGVPLIGCSTAGGFSAAGPSGGGAVVTALGGTGFRVITRATEGLSSGQREAGRLAAEPMAELGDAGQPLLIMFTDGQIGRQEEVVRGAYGVLGAGIPIAGGCAAADGPAPATYVLHGDRVLSDAVVSAAIRSDGEFGVGVAHGYRPVGDPLMVTRSGDGFIFEFDDKPALDLYLDRLGAPPDAYHDEAAFAAFAMHHPLGLSRRSGEEMRFVARADFGIRAILPLADVPDGGTVRLMTGDEEDLLAAAATARLDAMTALTAPALGLLAVDCTARRAVLADDKRLAREVQLLAGSHLPLSGFYSLGEIARVRGITGFHHQTVVVLAVS